MQFALCLLASLVIAGDALETKFDYYEDDGYDFAPQTQENDASSSESQYDDDLDFEKRAWSRIRPPADNDRGNRDMPTKFMHEMTQCRGRNTRVNLFEHFHLSPDKVEFHDAHFNNSIVSVECVQVKEDDAKRVRNPCAYFPQSSDVRLCYVRNTQCSTVHRQHIVWMRDILGGAFSDWYWKRVTFGVGCHCNLEFHH